MSASHTDANALRLARMLYGEHIAPFDLLSRDQVIADTIACIERLRTRVHELELESQRLHGDLDAYARSRGEHGGYFVALPPEAGSSARQWFAPIEDEA